MTNRNENTATNTNANANEWQLWRNRRTAEAIRANNRAKKNAQALLETAELLAGSDGKAKRLTEQLTALIAELDTAITADLRTLNSDAQLEQTADLNE